MTKRLKRPCKTWPRTNSRSLVRQVFGRLRVVEETKDRASNGSIIWRCVCQCGGEAFVMTGNLLSGNTLSCGCFQRIASRKSNIERAISKHKK